MCLINFLIQRSYTAVIYDQIMIMYNLQMFTLQPRHTTYRKNIKNEKCAGIGLNGFIFQKINKKYCINEKKDPGSSLGFACPIWVEIGWIGCAT